MPPIVLYVAEEVTGLEGNSATLQFSIARASPPVQPTGIRWFFQPTGANNAEDITQRNSLPDGSSTLAYSDNRLSLTVGEITQQSGGLFTLSATNPAGTASNSTNLITEGKRTRSHYYHPIIMRLWHFRIFLFFSPATPRIISPPQNQTVYIDGTSSSVMFTCKAYAVPAPEILWQYITADGAVNINVNGRINTNTDVMSYNRTSTLSFSSVQFTDRGQYVCVATNDHSSAPATATLTVGGKLMVVPFEVTLPSRLLFLPCLAYKYHL